MALRPSRGWGQPRGGAAVVRRTRRRAAIWSVPLGIGALLLLGTIAAIFALFGGDICLGAGGSGGAAGPPPTRAAAREIPPEYLRLYREMGRRYDISWPFLASVGAQESNHGRAPDINRVNYAGCVGPMQLGVGGACGDFFGTYGQDGNGDGRKDPRDPADAVATAAYGLRKGKGAPPAGGSFAGYRKAACGYYGACGDANVNYADAVMARAVQYGFRGGGAPPATDSTLATPVASGNACGGAVVGPANVREAVTVAGPREFRMLPAALMAGGYAPQPVDSRIWADVVWLLRRYDLRVTAAREPGHQTHGDGTAIDAVPATGGSQAAWDATAGRAAADLGWTPTCGGSGTRPACDLVPAIQFIGYDGYPSHGSPRTCGGGCPRHIHISWVSDTFGTSFGPPPGAVKVFPVPDQDRGGGET